MFRSMTASRHLRYPSLESLRAQSSDRCCSTPTSRFFKASFHQQLEAPSMPTTQQHTPAVLRRRFHIR